MTSISIIIPYYNSFNKPRLELAVKSIFSQKLENIELIIGNNYQAKKVRDNLDLNTLEETMNESKIYVGKIINRSLKIAEGDYTYISDADIVFRSSTFFKDLISISKNFNGIALKRPPMRRLFLEDFDEFYKSSTEYDLSHAIKTFDCSQKYIIKPLGQVRVTKSFPKFENGRQKVFIASEKEFQEYLSHEENKGSEPKFFNQDRHCGATFAPTKALREIGGYCEDFISWGVWDADVQWKLANTLGIRLIDYDEAFEVIHLDHLKRYFDREKWLKDKTLQKVRRDKGYESSIEYDRLIYFGEKNG